MLQAKMSNGKMVIAARLTKGQLATLKETKQEFRCPVCNEQVILKAGTKVIPHFAHTSRNTCPTSQGGEGEYHERGKLLLYNWLKSQRIEVQLEQYVPEINQQPDLLVQVNEKTIAIEYQCARIPREQIQMRNQGYKKADIIPIWIIGANRLKRRSSIHFGVEQMTLQLIHQFSPNVPKVIYYFCPYTLQLIRLYDGYLTQTNQLLAKMKVNKLNEMNFKDIFTSVTFSEQEIFSRWKNEKKYFRLRASKAYGAELAWRQWLYLKGTQRDFLPSVIHLPTPSQHQMKTPPWNWQSRLCLELIHPLPIGRSVSLRNCVSLLRNHLHSPSQSPLIHSQGNPIEEYLQLLTHLQILEHQTASPFVKINPLEFHPQVEIAITKDFELMDELAHLADKMEA